MIHPQAIVHASARIADDVEIGPWTLIGENVDIASGCVIHSHVVIKGPTSIGKNNQIYQFSTIGEDTPDLKYKGEPTRLEIGDNNIIREGVTIHRGTVQDKGLTSIGNHNLIMAYVHIGHDSIVKDHCILVNNTALAGHVVIDDWAILSGYTLVHQFCHIGKHAFTGMGTAVGKDIPAYIMVNGNPAEAHNINVEGLKRRGFSSEQIALLRKAYKIVYRQGHTLEEAVQLLQQLQTQGDTQILQLLIDSLQQSTRGIVR